MYIENLCCVAKGLQKAAEKISPVVWVYTAGEDEEAVDIFNQNFFYDVVEKLRTDDLLLIYTPLENTKIYWAKIIKTHNNITLEAISTGGGAGGDVISVNGKNGVVVLSAADILNQAQLDAVNSGITAEKVAEYDHNLEEFEQLSGEVATLEAEQQVIKTDLGDLGDQVIENNNAIATKNNIFQLDVFPDLNTPNVPNPFQYVGETIGSAIKGHFYEKVETDFTQWQRTDNQTFVVTMGEALVGDDVYQADGKTVIGTITEISDSAMTYTDTDGQSISTAYHSVFHTSGFEEVYTFGDDTVAKYTQGGTPFYEMYSNENPYRKLTVDCYYPRPQTFIITTSDGYYGKLFVVMGGNNLGSAEVRVITEKGTAPFEIKYGNVQALSGSGHYSVDVFIHKKSSFPYVLNIKPYIQGISSFTKVYTADDFVVSTADDFTNATKTATISTEYTTIDDSSTSSNIKTWSAKKLESLLLTSKNIVNTSGTIISQNVDFNTEYLQALTSLGCKYFIRNGICHVRFGFKVLKDFTDIKSFELPGGAITVFGMTIPSKTNPEKAIELTYFYGGVKFLNGLAGDDEYYLMFSYPIV